MKERIAIIHFQTSLRFVIFMKLFRTVASFYAAQ